MREPKYFKAIWALAAILLAAAAFLGAFPASDVTTVGLVVQQAQTVNSASGTEDGEPLAKTIVFQSSGQIAHAPTIAQAADGSLHALWFAGEDEADRTIGLYHAVHRDGRWGEARMVFHTLTEAGERGIHFQTLGNPVLHVDQTGGFWLFYVSPSMGGWATSKISLRRSNDMGASWSEAKVLRASPFFNISKLVKSPVVALENGYIGLPIHFELVVKYGELAVIDENGDLVGLRRIGQNSAKGLQPLIIAGSQGNAEAFLRPDKRMEDKLYRSESSDGGVSWSDPEAMSFDNPGSPACGVAHGKEGMLIGFNDDDDLRSNIRLAHRATPQSEWFKLAMVAEAQIRKDQLSYCQMIRAEDGSVHMVYSNRPKGRIWHIRFSPEYLAGQLQEADK